MSSEPRLVVSSHDSTGKTSLSDTSIPLFYPGGPTGSSFAVFDIRAGVPVTQTTDGSFPSYSNTIPRCPPNGVIFCVSNIAPNFTVPMHRTISLDYAVVMSGEVVVKVDSGEETTVRAGEFIVQGGTNHQWINRTGEYCRIAFVMVGAEKVRTEGGEVLDEIVPKRPGQ